MAERSRNAFPRRPTVARSRRDVFSGCRPWQDIAAVRFRGSSRGEIMPRCVPGRRSVAAFSLHAFPKGSRTGKAPLPGNISPPCIQNELASARYARRASEKPRERAFGDAPREDLAMKGPFSLRGPLESCTARGSCRRSALAGRRALCVEGRGAGLRKRTLHCCRRSRAPARHLVALCGGSLSRSRAPRPAARCTRSHDPPPRSPRPAADALRPFASSGFSRPSTQKTASILLAVFARL